MGKYLNSQQGNKTFVSPGGLVLTLCAMKSCHQIPDSNKLNFSTLLNSPSGGPTGQKGEPSQDSQNIDANNMDQSKPVTFFLLFHHLAADLELQQTI